MKAIKRIHDLKLKMIGELIHEANFLYNAAEEVDIAIIDALLDSMALKLSEDRLTEENVNTALAGLSQAVEKLRILRG